MLKWDSLFNVCIFHNVRDTVLSLLHMWEDVNILWLVNGKNALQKLDGISILFPDRLLDLTSQLNE